MSNSSLKIIFAGTPDFAATHLDALCSAGKNIIAVFTQPDRPAGRGNPLTASPVKILATKKNIPVFQPENLKTKENQSFIESLQADLMIVVAYGLILPKSVLDMPRLGCLNVHGSLLPRWRGAAPIQRACWAGDPETGVTVMQMNEGLDTGDMLYKISCPILPDDTSETLYHKLAQLGSEALLKTLTLIETNQLAPEKQNDSLATYATKLSKEEARLNWQHSAEALDREIRAFNPWPVSYFVIDGQNIKVRQANVIAAPEKASPGTIMRADKHGIQVMTAKDILNITQLQPSGKKNMTAQELLNSRREAFVVGKILD